MTEHDLLIKMELWAKLNPHQVPCLVFECLEDCTELWKHYRKKYQHGECITNLKVKEYSICPIPFLNDEEFKV
jgi:hypothetical protein